jgi:hypothetical protein
MRKIVQAHESSTAVNRFLLPLMAAAASLAACSVYDASLAATTQRENFQVSGSSAGSSGLASVTAGSLSNPANAAVRDAAVRDAAARDAADGGVHTSTITPPSALAPMHSDDDASTGETSDTCGNAQLDDGEICDSAIAQGTQGACAQACTSSDTCVHTQLEGDAAHCNAQCVSQSITSVQAGDGCCPAGANANTDSDCKPSCGNGIIEAGEACDTGTGCSATCQLSLPADQLACIDKFGDSACTRCQCEQCGSAVSACIDSGDTTRDAGCFAVEGCATSHGCAGTACYCGSSSMCSIAPSGACQTEIEQAADSQNLLVIQAAYLDSKSALGRAETLGECRRSHCASACP